MKGKLNKVEIVVLVQRRRNRMGKLVLVLMLYVIAVTIAIIPWWRIAKKVGYSGAWSLLILIPVVNLIAIYWFAFTEWPLERRAVKIRIE